MAATIMNLPVSISSTSASSSSSSIDKGKKDYPNRYLTTSHIPTRSLIFLVEILAVVNYDCQFFFWGGGGYGNLCLLYG